MTLRSMVTWLGLAVGLAALGVQMAISVPARMAMGDSLPAALLYYFCFFTILTNTMLVLIYLSVLTRWRWLEWWRWPSTRAMMVGAIVLVMVFYHFMLAGLWNPQGWQKVADVALHYVTPVAYVGWWLAFSRHGDLSWRHLWVMVVPPALYLLFTLARGAVINWYPYEVFNPAAPAPGGGVIGYGGVTTNVAMLLVALLVLWSLAILVDRLLAGRQMRGA